MPSGEIHDWLAMKLFNVDKKKARLINKIIDLAHIVHGKKHRKYWGHDPLSLLIIYKSLKDDRDALKVGGLHIITDLLSSNNKKFENTLKLLKILEELKK